jgi:type II secretory pathway component PulK
MRNDSIVDLEPINPKSEIRNRKSRGVTIIAAIFIIVVLGFMGVMFLSMVNTGSFTAVNDLQSAQALYVAEGGLEYYGNRAFPDTRGGDDGEPRHGKLHGFYAHISHG